MSDPKFDSPLTSLTQAWWIILLRCMTGVSSSVDTLCSIACTGACRQEEAGAELQVVVGEAWKDLPAILVTGLWTSAPSPGLVDG